MGWLFYNRIPTDIRAEIEGLWTFENEERAVQPLQSWQIGSTWYLAVEVTIKTPEAKPTSYPVDAFGRYVFAAVVLTRQGGGEWGYKDMDETCGPNESGAPPALLAKLTPTTSDYANDWRDRCRARATLTGRKLAHGDEIELAEPLRFTDGIERRRFKVHKGRNPGDRRASTSFVCLETGIHCRIRGIMQWAWAKI